MSMLRGHTKPKDTVLAGVPNHVLCSATPIVIVWV